jgi:hypothetical protein
MSDESEREPADFGLIGQFDLWANVEVNEERMREAGRRLAEEREMQLLNAYINSSKT